jgi:exodeoxyribonuclease VII small subunit
MIEKKEVAIQPSFEDAITELEGIIARMEVGRMSLEESLAAYQRGVVLLRECQETLDAAEKQIRILQDDKLQEFSLTSADDTKDE